MILALLLWSAVVAAVWWFGGAVMALLTPAQAWLEANPDIGAWVQPVLSFGATLGVSAVVIVWLAGVALIALVWRIRPVERARSALSGDDWRRRDSWDDEPERSYRRPRRRNRRDDDDDDD